MGYIKEKSVLNLRVPAGFISRLDALSRGIEAPIGSALGKTRSDMAREAMRRGIESLEAEFQGSGYSDED